QQLHPGRPAQDSAAYRAGLVLHAVLLDPARDPADRRLAVPGGDGDGHRDPDPLFPAVARSRRGEVDPLPRPALQERARDLRGDVPDPRLPRHGADHGVGPVPRGRRIAVRQDPRHQGRRDLGRAVLHDPLLRVLFPDALVYGDRQVPAGAGKGHLMRKALLLALFAPVVALAAEATYRLDRAPIDPRDLLSLQAGARTFVNYCLNCHGAQYMRYNRLTDLGLTEAQIKDNLILTDAKIGDTMKVTLSQKDGKTMFGAAPPDLS